MYKITSRTTIEVDGVDGYGKISHSSGCTLVEAVFFNPINGKSVSLTVRDYDYADCSRDREDLYRMPLNKDAIHAWKIHRGIIEAGDTVEVFKGRKIPKGTVAKVLKVTDWYDRYGKWRCTYAWLDCGENVKTNIGNCRLVEKA